jgi:hypothetical protein
MVKLIVIKNKSRPGVLNDDCVIASLFVLFDESRKKNLPKD